MALEHRSNGRLGGEDGASNVVAYGLLGCRRQVHPVALEKGVPEFVTDSVRGVLRGQVCGDGDLPLSASLERVRRARKGSRLKALRAELQTGQAPRAFGLGRVEPVAAVEVDDEPFNISQVHLEMVRARTPVLDGALAIL